MTIYDTLSKLTNEELTLIIYICQAEINSIDSEVDKLERTPSPNAEVEKRFEELFEWRGDVFDILAATETILDLKNSE